MTHGVFFACCEQGNFEQKVMFCIQKYSVYERLYGEVVQCPLLEVTPQTPVKNDASTPSLASLEG